MANEVEKIAYQKIEKYIALMSGSALTLCNNALVSLKKLNENAGPHVKKNIQELLSGIINAWEQDSFAEYNLNSIDSLDDEVAVLGNIIVREIETLLNTSKHTEKPRTANTQELVELQLPEQEQTEAIAFLNNIETAPTAVHTHIYNYINENSNDKKLAVVQIGLQLAYNLSAGNLQIAIKQANLSYKLANNNRANPILAGAQELLTLTDNYTNSLLNPKLPATQTSINVERACLLINLIDKTSKFVQKPNDEQKKNELINANKNIKNSITYTEYFKDLLSHIIATITFSTPSNTPDSKNLCDNLNNITPRLIRASGPG